LLAEEFPLCHKLLALCRELLDFFVQFAPSII